MCRRARGEGAPLLAALWRRRGARRPSYLSPILCTASSNASSCQGRGQSFVVPKGISHSMTRVIRAMSYTKNVGPSFFGGADLPTLLA